MTPSERAAWRDGVGDAAVFLRAMARRIRDKAKGCTVAMSNAATLEQAADALAETVAKSRAIGATSNLLVKVP